MAEQTRKSIRWSVIDQISKQGIILLTSAVLARLITPEEFGMMGIIMAFQVFFHNLIDFGFEASIIRKKELGKEELSTIFWTVIGFSVVLAALFILLAPAIALFFRQPELTGLIRLTSVSLLCGAAGVIPNAFIQKLLRFKDFFTRHLISYLLGGIIGIYLAWKGYGVWALVWQHLAVIFLNTVISMAMVQWRPSLHFKASLLQTHFRFSLPFMGHSVTNYWIRHIDYLLIGRMLSAHALGIYSRAYNLMIFPVNQIANTITRVAFPALSKHQDNKPLIWNAFAGLLSSVAVVVFPMMAIAGIYSRELIHILFGNQWEAAVPVFKILCGLGALQSLLAMAGPVYLSTGSTRTMFKVSLITYPFILAAMIAGLLLGQLEGLAWGYLVGGAIAFLIEMYIVSRMFGKNLSDCFQAFSKEFMATVIVMAILIAFRLYVPFSDFQFITIFLHALAGCLALGVYIYLLRLSKSQGLKTIASLVGGRGRN